MPYLSASAVGIHYKQALYQVYGPLPFYHISHYRGVDAGAAEGLDPLKYVGGVRVCFNSP